MKVTPASAPVWHPDVRTYDMHDEQGTHVASFYADWFPAKASAAAPRMNPSRSAVRTATASAPTWA